MSAPIAPQSDRIESRASGVPAERSVGVCAPPPNTSSHPCARAAADLASPHGHNQEGHGSKDMPNAKDIVEYNACLKEEFRSDRWGS